jgi:hypothetical protein
MDAKSFNIFVTMVKEKVEGLKPYAQVRGLHHLAVHTGPVPTEEPLTHPVRARSMSYLFPPQSEFDGLCAEFDLNAKFRQVADAHAKATKPQTHEHEQVQEPLEQRCVPESVRAWLVGRKHDAIRLRFGSVLLLLTVLRWNSHTPQTTDGPSSSLAGLSAEDLARHRRMAIKQKELAELKEMQDRVRGLAWGQCARPLARLNCGVIIHSLIHSHARTSHMDMHRRMSSSSRRRRPSRRPRTRCAPCTTT